MHSRLRLAAVLVASAIAVSGCNDILTDQAAQQDLIGSPVVTTERCFFGSNSASPPAVCEPMVLTKVDETLEGLIAYQVPPDVGAPSTLSGVTDAPGDARQTTYRFSQSYTDQLEVTSPALPGLRWRGYMSEPETYTAAQHVNQVETISARFELPRGSDGGPARGPFRWLTVIGLRVVNDTDLPASRPVGGCGTDLVGGYVTPGQAAPVTDTWCGNFPLVLPAPSSLITSDLGMTPPSLRSSPAGRSLDVPFGWELAGPGVGTPFGLSAQTDVPGASAAPADGTLSPGSDSKGTELVHLTLPAGASPGDYHVTLAARLPNGQTRSSTATVRVDPAAAAAVLNAGAPPPDRSGPRLTVAGVLRQTLRNALAHGVSLGLGCSEPCTLVATLLLEPKTAGRLHLSAGDVRAGARTVSLRRAGRVSVRVPFAKRVKKRLRKAASVRIRVKVLGVDGAGNRTATTRTLRLR